MSFGSSGGGGQQTVSRPATGAERGDVFNWGIKSISDALGYTRPSTTTTRTVSGAGGTQSMPTGLFATALSNSPYALAFNPRWYTPATTQPAGATTETVSTPTGPALPFAAYDPWSADALYASMLQSRMAPLVRQETLQRQNLNQDLANRGIWSSGIAGQLQNDLSEKLAPSYLQAGGEAGTAAYNAALQEKQAAYEGLWRPLEYLLGLYNQTGGVFSNASSSGPSGWQFSR